MARKRELCTIILLIMSLSTCVYAQDANSLGLRDLSGWLPTPGQNVSPGSSPFFSGIPRQNGAYLTVGLRKYINSFTSKEFPSDPASSLRLDPESRLEFPWQQTLGVVKLGGVFYGIQANFEGAATLFMSSEPMIQDSDWLDPENPGQKTKFGEGNNFPRCWTFDTSVGYTLPVFSSVQLLLGYRVQQFRFTWMDGVEHSLVDPVDYMKGEVIQFSQHYGISYLGGVVYFMLPYNFSGRLAGDVGGVIGKNVDNHLHRDQGQRMAYMSTRGTCWHVNLALELALKNFQLGVTGDFMNINTNGGHNLVYPGSNTSWDGARVWSEQKYIEVNAAFSF